MTKVPWRKLKEQKPPPRWVRGPGGAQPIDPTSRRRMRLGTARLAANRGSERVHRMLRSAFFSVIELMVVILAVSWIGSWVWHLYEGASTGRAVLQGVLAAVAASVWLVFTRERYRHEQHRDIAIERDLERRADQAAAAERTTRMDRVDPAGPPSTIRSSANWPPRRDGGDQSQGFVDPDRLPEEPL